MTARDSAELLFEPTGDIAKDYSAYCEIDDKPEREDFLDGIFRTEASPPGGSGADAASPTGTTDPRGRIRTQLILRNIEPPGLHKRDAQPLINSIPHCTSLQKVHLTNCAVTEHSYKLLVEAAYKSPTVTSFALDFNNTNGLLKDTSVSRKDKNEVTVNPAHYRGQHLKHDEPSGATEAKGKKVDPKKAAAAKALMQQQQAEEATQEKPLLTLPTGFHAIFYSGIQQLSLRGNGIGDSQVQLMMPLLENNTELLALSLWGNNITSVGVASIAQALTKNRKLTALNLGHNRIDDAGLEALTKVFFNIDVTNEEALKHRQRSGYPQVLELPAYPTYQELLTAATAPPQEEATGGKKDPKKKDAGKGGKGSAPGPVERHKTDFDKDCFRLDDQHVRIPGNSSLWALNLSHNAQVTAKGVEAWIAVLESCEPEFEKAVPNADGAFSVPDHYAPASLALTSLELTHPKLDGALITAVNEALEKRHPTTKEALVENPK